MCGCGGGGKGWLGAEAIDTPYDTKSYYVNGDKHINIQALNNMVSCQSGGIGTCEYFAKFVED